MNEKRNNQQNGEKDNSPEQNRKVQHHQDIEPERDPKKPQEENPS